MSRIRNRELDTNNIGRFLKNKRHKAKISLKEISDKMNTRPRYIKYLEENNLQKLVENNLYIDGFLKNYIKVLDLNVSSVEIKNLLMEFEKNKKPFIDLKKDMKPTREMLRYSILVLLSIYLFFICLFAIQKRTFNIVYKYDNFKFSAERFDTLVL